MFENINAFMKLRNLKKMRFFIIRISSENRLKYLGCGHVSAQNYSISIKFICLGIYRCDKIYVKLRTYSHAKQIFCVVILITMTSE